MSGLAWEPHGKRHSAGRARYRRWDWIVGGVLLIVGPMVAYFIWEVVR